MVGLFEQIYCLKLEFLLPYELIFILFWKLTAVNLFFTGKVYVIDIVYALYFIILPLIMCKRNK